MIGVEIGNWHYARSGLAWNSPVPSTAPFQLEALGWLKTTLRVATGVLMVCNDALALDSMLALIHTKDICMERNYETSHVAVIATCVPHCGETWIELTPKIFYSSIVSINISRRFCRC